MGINIPPLRKLKDGGLNIPPLIKTKDGVVICELALLIYEPIQILSIVFFIFFIGKISNKL